ncbi:HIRAN domain-containing protein [Aerococcaceae bacterium zg-BR22]|uniref:HIRAN domain-containing protein n=1 Tax=Aerococcaceae bacterium zg-1292 TaxID=2774330 RepID=UPI0040649973|nr:HIRAN domain-containing protein [Aerococcaceae bacterium zg-BR22]
MSTIHFQPSPHLIDFHLAGFAYYDGLDVIEELKLGQVVELAFEANNPFDPQAIAVLYKEKKLGYVPTAKNDLLFTLIYFGYSDILHARIQMVDTQTHPERQLRVVVNIKDNRNNQEQ